MFDIESLRPAPRAYPNQPPPGSRLTSPALLLLFLGHTYADGRAPPVAWVACSRAAWASVRDARGARGMPAAVGRHARNRWLRKWITWRLWETWPTRPRAVGNLGHLESDLDCRSRTRWLCSVRVMGRM